MARPRRITALSGDAAADVAPLNFSVWCPSLHTMGCGQHRQSIAGLCRNRRYWRWRSKL